MDIGADRGLLSLALEKNGHKVYATENKKGPYDALCTSLKISGSKNVYPFFLDGMKKVEKDVDTVAILGMGWRTIFSILEEGVKKYPDIKIYVIEPQSAFSLPISFLLDHGYKNIAGSMINETRYYPLLKFVKNCEEIAYNSAERSFGPYLFHNHDENLLTFLQEELRRLDSLSEIGKKRHQNEIDLLKGAIELWRQRNS